MARIPDYYSVLGVARSADAAEIKRAYREQALRHHPDKNPDRLEEATERFKLIGEAYSVLRDPQQRAAYDRGGHSEGAFAARSQQSSSYRGDDRNFSADKARELFRDVFGDEFTAMLARAAERTAPHVKAAANATIPHVKAAAEATASGINKVGERVSRSKVVHRAVSSHLSTMTDDALSDAAATANAEDCCRKSHEASLKKLQDHSAICDDMRKARADRQVSWWESLQTNLGLWETEQQIADSASDSKAEASIRALRREVESADVALRRSREDVAHAEAAVCRALEAEASAHENGVSFEQATEAGKHFLWRLADKVDRRLQGLDKT